MSKYTPFIVIAGLIVFGLIFSGADFNIFKVNPMFELSPQEVDAAASSQTVSLTVTTTLQLTLATTTLALGILSPGTPVTATTSAAVTTNNGTGWSFTTKRDDASSTLDLTSSSTIDFLDYTAWTQGTYCSAGGNAATSPGATLSFRTWQAGTTPSELYCIQYWGTNDSGGTAKYGGFPTTAQEIAKNTAYSSTSQTVVYGLRADAPGTQPGGSYDGTITMTALANAP